MESQTNKYISAMNWLHNHQNPSILHNDMNIIVLSHPLCDGDGLATRIGRLVGNIVPYILKGYIVILEGGFRGYTHPDLGFESLFEPFSNIKKDKNNFKIVTHEKDKFKTHWERYTPLFSEGKKWWYGIILNYFMRPNKDLKHYIDEKMKRLGISSFTKYIGMHVRRGDNHTGLKYGFGDYYKVLTKEIIPHWLEKNYLPIKPNVYLATDSSEIQYLFGKVQNEHFKVVFEKNGSLDMSKPGQSAANIMIVNEKNVPLVKQIGFEVVTDIIILSQSVFLVGIMTSQITKIAAAMAKVRENIVHDPIALDYNLRIDWVRKNCTEMYNGDITPFAKPS